MPTLLPHDSDNKTIPVMRLKSSGAHVIAAGGSSARNSAAFDDETRVISVYADVPVYMAFGDSSVSASSVDHYFPAGVYYDFAVGGDRTGQASHVAVRAVSTTGSVYISEKE